MRSKAIAYWNTYGWRLALALLLSLLLHAVLLSGLEFHLPAITSSDHTVEVRLAPAIPVKPPQNIAQAPVKRIKKPPLKTEPKSIPEPTPATPVQTPSPPPEPAIADNSPVADVPAESAVQTDAAISAAQDTPAEGAEASQPVAVILNGQSYVDMDFDVFRSGDSNTIGTAHISYKQFEDGSYKLTSTTEARGLIALFISGQLVQTSEGKVTNYGLRPEHFSYNFAGKAEKSQHANFDWATHTLTMQTSKNTDTVPLADGTQDLLSFIYQFMFVPPLQQMRVAMTNGRKLYSYEYQFAGEEYLKTKLGELRTLHVYRTGDNDEKIELWLAVDYHFLPVKIGKTNKDGSAYEQIVTRLSTDILK